MAHYLLIKLHKVSVQAQIYIHGAGGGKLCVYAYMHRYMCAAKCFGNYIAGAINHPEFQFMDIHFLECITLKYFHIGL